ncbi:nucleotidyltransferase [Brucella sp. TWI559]
MSVSDNFRAFRSNYLIPADTISSISYRYRRITRQLNRDFWSSESDNAHSLYVGSYGRDTAAKGVSDLDVAFLLPNYLMSRYSSYTSNGQSALLQQVRASLLKTYGTTRIGGDGQVVVIGFDDGITFEVLPVFNNMVGTYTFADSNNGGSWKTCNPRAEMDAFLARNRATNGNLKALARMARIWKRRHSVGISGMLIDTLAYQFIETWAHKERSYTYHDWMVRDFFSYLGNLDRNQQFWRAPGSGASVMKTGNFHYQANRSYSDAVSAISLEMNDYKYTARLKWREIFGPTYP